MRTVAKAVAYDHAPKSADTPRRAGRILAAALALAALSGTAVGWAGHAAAEPIPAPVHPVASPMEDQAAEQAFLTQFGIATAVGGFGGTVVGAGVGCLVGAGIIALPTAFIGTPVGCGAGAAAGAALGGVVGTIGAGGVALPAAGADVLATLAAAPGTTKWAQR